MSTFSLPKSLIRLTCQKSNKNQQNMLRAEGKVQQVANLPISQSTRTYIDPGDAPPLQRAVIHGEQGRNNVAHTHQIEQQGESHVGSRRDPTKDLGKRHKISPTAC